MSYVQPICIFAESELISYMFTKQVGVQISTYNRDIVGPCSCVEDMAIA